MEIEYLIKHYESLQKRYKSTHNGKMCELTKATLDILCKIQKEKRLIHFELQKGDQMTGFEIIASLPLEEQQKIKRHACPEDFGLKNGKCTGEEYQCRPCLIQALNSLYTWNGKEWGSSGQS